MKRVRLRRGWVLLAVFLLVIPFLGRGAGDVRADETSVGQQYTIAFSSTAGDMDNSLDVARWDMALGTATGFVPYNPGTMSAQVTFTDGKAVDSSLFDSIAWVYETKQVSTAISVTGLQDPADALKCNFTTNVNNAGLILVEVSATFVLKGDATQTPFTIRRELIIAAPLQIKSETYLGEDYKLIRSPNDLYHSEVAHKLLPSIDYIYANHTSDAVIYWYYKDALTNTLCELQNPSSQASSSNTLDYMGTTQVERQTNTVPYSGKDYYQYKVTAKYGGMTTLVARIYLNNSLTQAYIEREFEIITVAGVTHAKNHDSDSNGIDDIYQVELKFGQSASFASLSNDKGNTLGWSVESPDVVKLSQTTGIIGNYYGTTIVNLTPIAKNYKSYSGMTFAADVYDKLLVFTKATLLKGSTDAARVTTEEIEALSIGSDLVLSTNVQAKDSSYQYKWYYVDDNGVEYPFAMPSGSDIYAANCIKAVGESIAASGDYTHLKITGMKTGTATLRCKVDVGGKTETLEVKVKVIDTLTLNESEKRIPQGSTFTLRGTSSSASPMTFTSSNPTLVSVTPVAGRNNEATVAGLNVTNGQWITITVSQEVGGQTLMSTCRVQVIEAVTEGTIEGNKTILVDKTTDLTLTFVGNPPNYTSDEIKWVIKNKDGTTGVIELINGSSPLQVTVKGLKIGEAYVAVVLNDSVQTEIAIATIRVVAKPDGLVLNEHNLTVYLPDKTYQLTYTIEPAGYVDGNQTVSWQSLDESIATVDANGLVTYQSVGTVMIRAYVSGADDLSDYCTFVIENPAISLAIDPTTASMKVGETLSIKSTILPENTSNRTLTWTSTNTSVAEVSPAGVVTAKGAGGATITCTTSNGITASCAVTVQVPVASIELNYTEIIVKKDTVFYMAAKVLPFDAFDREVIWSVSDTAIISIEQDGTVTAQGVGEAIITATSRDDSTIKAECIVTVEEGVSGITLNVRDKTIAVGEQFVIIPSVRPSDAVNKNVTYTSSNAGVATVDADGLVTGLHGGTTIITVKTEERGLIATCTVTVQEDIKAISLNMGDIYLGKGQTKKITYTLLPATATMKSLKWTSSDESIAIVDNEGNVRGINLGTVTITAQAKDAGGIKATCKVTVINAATKINLSDQMIKMLETTQYQMQFTMEPASASVQKVTWTTSDPSVARVDSFGVITAVGEGECDITATAADGSEITASCKVVVIPYIPIASVSVNSTETTMVVGDSRKLTTRIYPYNTTEDINWMSGDTSIVTVDESGNVRAVGPGTTTVSAMGDTSGVSSAATITVLGLNAMDITLEQYDSYDLYLDGVSKGITWFSRDKRIATVTAGGKVIARRPGTTTVVARVNGKLVSCSIKVEALKKITQVSAQ